MQFGLIDGPTLDQMPQLVDADRPRLTLANIADVGRTVPPWPFALADHDAPFSDGPMRSLATLGVPPILLGNVAGGIPLSRLADVVRRDANVFGPLIRSGETGGGLSLPPLGEETWHNPSAIAPDEQDGAGSAPVRAWDDFALTDHDPIQQWPSLDPRPRDLEAPTELDEAAQAPDDGQIAVADIPQQLESGGWGDNVPRIVVTPQQFEPWATPEDRAEIFSYRPDYHTYPSAAADVAAAFADDRFDLREQKNSAPYDDVGLEPSISDADPDYVWAGAKYAARGIRPGGRPSTEPALRPLYRGPAPILTSTQLDRLDFFSLQRHLGWLAPKHPQLQNLSGPNWRPTSQDRENMRAQVEQTQRHVVAVRQNRRYQDLGDRPENHHVDPKFLGGPENGPTVPLPRDYHRVITTEFMQHRKYGLPYLSRAKRLEIMRKVYDKFPLPW